MLICLCFSVLPAGADETRSQVVPGGLRSRHGALTRAPLGGGAESAPLLDFLNNSKTVADIDTKFGVPYPT